MKTSWKILIATLSVGLFLSACQSKMTGIEAIEIWARPAIKDGNGAVYMAVKNHSDQADELVAALTDVANVVELHKSEVNDQGVMVMLKQDSFPLPARGEFLLEPGGYHIMVLGLKRDLKWC